MINNQNGTQVRVTAKNIKKKDCRKKANKSITKIVISM